MIIYIDILKISIGSDVDTWFTGCCVKIPQPHVIGHTHASKRGVSTRQHENYQDRINIIANLRSHRE